MFSTVQMNREKFEEKNKLSSKSKRAKSCELKDVDECVLTWLKQWQREEFSIGGPIMQEKDQNYVVFSEARQGKNLITLVTTF